MARFKGLLLVVAALASLIAIVMLMSEQPVHDGQKCTLLDSKTPYEPQKQMRCPDGMVYDR